MHGSTFWLFFYLMLSSLSIVLAALYLRHRKQLMLHQERLAALEKGTQIPLGREPAPWSPRVYLLRGLIWSFSGVAVIISLLALSVATQQPQTRSAVWLAQDAKNVSERLGISLEQARAMVEKDEASRPQRGLPMSVSLLGGLPLAVGLAYLVFYYTDESRRSGGPPQS